MPPLLVDLIHARACKPFCEKSLTLPLSYEHPPKGAVFFLFFLERKKQRTFTWQRSKSGKMGKLSARRGPAF